MLYLLSSEEQKYLIADYKRSKLSFLSSGEEINNLCRRTKAKGVIFILYYPEYLEYDIRYLDAKIGPAPVNSVFPAPNIWFDKEFKKYVLPILKAGKRLSE